MDVVVSCGAEDLFLEKAGKNASYMSKIAAVEFVEAVGLWAEESNIFIKQETSESA